MCRFGRATEPSSSSPPRQPRKSLDASDLDIPLYYILQFSHGEHGFSHCIVEAKDIVFPLMNLTKGRQVLFKHQQKHYKGLILYADTLSQCQTHLEDLQRSCFLQTTKSLIQTSSVKLTWASLEDFSWHLVSFRPDSSSITYAIVHLNDFEWRGKNYQYPFIHTCEKLNEVKVLKKSNDFKEILHLFRTLRMYHTYTPKTPVKGFRACLAKEQESQENKSLKFYYHYLNVETESPEISRTLNHWRQKKVFDELLSQQKAKIVSSSIEKITKTLHSLQISA